MAVSGGIAVPVSTSALLMAGMTLAGTASVLRTISDGTLVITGSVTTISSNPTTAITTQVSCSLSSIQLLDINGNRKGASVFNDSTTATLYLKYGTNASTSSFKAKLTPGAYFDFPQPVYTGLVHGIWTGPADGNALMSEEF